jgi:metastasis-associated protein MTA
LITMRKRRLPDAKVSEIAHTLGQPDRVTPAWLILTDKSKLPQPIKEAYPKPPKAPDGSLIYERVPERHVVIPSSISPSAKKRSYEDVNGLEGPAVKRSAWEGQGSTSVRPPSPGNSPMSLITQNISGSTGPNSRAAHHINGSKPSMTRIGSRKQIISWMDAPDDLYFRSTELSRKIRKTLSTNEMRRLARSPCKKVINKNIMELIGGPVLPAPISLGPGLITESKLTQVWRSMSPVDPGRDRR